MYLEKLKNLFREDEKHILRGWKTFSERLKNLFREVEKPIQRSWKTYSEKMKNIFWGWKTFSERLKNLFREVEKPIQRGWKTYIFREAEKPVQRNLSTTRYLSQNDKSVWLSLWSRTKVLPTSSFNYWVIFCAYRKCSGDVSDET